MDFLDKLSFAGLVPVIAINDAEDAVPLCRALAEGGLPVAFSAEISCNSPFAYKTPVSYTVITTGGDDYLRINYPAMTNNVFYPVIDISLTNATYIRFVNTDDRGRAMLIDDIPSGGSISIHIDCQNQIITASDGYNLYPGFNMKFLRLVPGDNDIHITTDGAAEVSMTCEYPVNIGA